MTGTGLTDGFPPGGVDAHDVHMSPIFRASGIFKFLFLQANQFIKKLPYDIMAIGKSVVITTPISHLSTILNIIHFSHELYVYANTFDM